MENTQNENSKEAKQDDETRQNKQDDEEARLEEYKKLVDQKTALRRSNLNSERPGTKLHSV
jgi:regulator of nonsense transcripts 2